MSEYTSSALPEKTGPNCWEELGIPANSPELVIMDAYRRRARETHPDHGGTSEAFTAVCKAKDIALSTIKHTAAA